MGSFVGRGRPIAVAVALFAGVTVATPAGAFKPSTHVQSAFEAYDDAVDDGRLTFEVAGGAPVSVPVSAEILDAIRAFPEAYRAGVLGPDAYPDIYVGQSMIHPDTRTDNDRQPPDPGRRSYTDDWLRHVWTSAHAEPAGPARQQAVAFAVGFLTHAAGDIWGHTLVNEFAQGVFPSVTDVGEAAIAVRHVVVEGYIDHRRPVPPIDPADLSSIDPPDDFVVRTFITSEFARAHSEPLHFDLFLNRRATLQADVDRDVRDLRVQDPSWFDAPANPLERWLLEARVAVNRGHVAAVDRGLAKWPEFSTKIAQAVLAPEGDFAAAKEEAIRFGFSTVAPMLGVPPAVGDSILALRAWYLSLDQRVRDLLRPITDLVAQVEEIGVNFLLDRFIDVSTLPPGMKEVVDRDRNDRLSLDELRALSVTDVLVNDPAVVAPADKAGLDALLGVDAEHPTFDPQRFGAYRNAATMAKLILLDRDGLNALAAQLGVEGELYPSDDPDSANAMLGWVRSLDGEYQWRSTSLRADDRRSFGFGTMRLWEDCRARDAVFRRVFAEPLPGAFSDDGDPCS